MIFFPLQVFHKKSASQLPPPVSAAVWFSTNGKRPSKGCLFILSQQFRKLTLAIYTRWLKTRRGHSGFGIAVNLKQISVSTCGCGKTYLLFEMQQH